jgi:hypothetical protein
VADVMKKNLGAVRNLLQVMVSDGQIVRPSQGLYAAPPDKVAEWEATRGAPGREAPSMEPKRSHAEQLRLSMPHPTYSKNGMYVSCGPDGKIIPIELARWQRMVGTLTEGSKGEGSPAPGVA